MQLSNERSDAGTTPNQEPRSGTTTDHEAKNVTTRRQSITNSYVDWCHSLITEWILWCLVGNISKDEDRKTDDFKTTPSRVDSGVELSLLGRDVSRAFDRATATPPAPITLLFHTQDGTMTKKLDYHAFFQWSNMDALLNELALDSIIVHMLWDINEDMPISCGDWDARIHPGSVIDAWCFNGEKNCDWNRDSSESEGEIEGVRGQKEHEKWWFARWRERVEREGVRREGAIEGPSWFMTVIWCMTIVAGIVVLGLVC